LETLRNMSKREKVLLLILLLVGSFFVFWQLIGVVWWEQYVHLREEMEMAQEEQERLESRLEEKPAIEAEWEEYQEKEAELKELLPPLGNLPIVLAELEKTLQVSEADINSLRADSVSREDNLGVVPLNLDVAGSEGRLLELLEDLEKFPHMLEIGQVSWSRADEGYRLGLDLYLYLSDLEENEQALTPEQIEEALPDGQENVLPEPEAD